VIFSKMKGLKKILKGKLTKKELMLLPSSFDMVGSILVFSDFPKELEKKEKLIAEEILKNFKNIKTVAKKTKKFSGKYRLPKIKIIAGKRTKETLHKENNCLFKLNVEKAYFSSRLSNERKRIFNLVKKNEDVLVMFSGIAPYAIEIAKNTEAREVYAVEINPKAHEYALENVRLNKLNNVNLFLGDVRVVLPKIKKKFDRIIMPLPKDSYDFLDIALKKIKNKAIVHFYTFANINEIKEVKENLKKRCEELRKRIKIMKIVKCGQYSPYVYRFCIDFKVEK